MKRLWIIILLICALSAAAINMATGAWFTSKVTGNGTFSSGKLSIKASDSIVRWGTFNINNIYPGWSQQKGIIIENDGSMDFCYRMYVDSSKLAGNLLFDGSTPLEVKVEKNGALIKDYTGLVNFGYTELGELKPDGSDELSFSFKLPKTADNRYQGNSAAIDLVFEARQKEASYSPLEVDIPKGGKVLYVGWDKLYKNITDAVTAAQDNDTIIVSGGPAYKENVIIDKPLTMIGRQDNHKPFDLKDRIMDNYFGSEPLIAPSNGDAITLKGRGTANVRIKGFKINSPAGAGITCKDIPAGRKVNNIAIENNLFTSNKIAPICFSSAAADGILISGNAFDCWSDGDQPAIALDGGTRENLNVCGNFIRGSLNYTKNSRGILLDGVRCASIKDNIILNLYNYCIRIAYGKDVMCSGNIMENISSGIQLKTVSYSRSENIYVRFNTINGANGNAISLTSLKDAPPGTFEDIFIEGNRINLDMTGKTSGTYELMCISPDQAFSGNHGKVTINDNNIKLTGTMQFSTLYGLTLAGKLNFADVINNVFDASSITAFKKPDFGIYIYDSSNGVPADADINLSGNKITGFNVDVRDTRKK